MGKVENLLTVCRFGTGRFMTVGAPPQGRGNSRYRGP